MNWKHRALIYLMKSISEDCWCATWMDGLEFALWQIVQNPSDNKYGQESVSPEDIQDIKEISTEIGGWFMWDDEANFPRFVPMEEWEGIFREWRHLTISLEATKQ